MRPWMVRAGKVLELSEVVHVINNKERFDGGLREVKPSPGSLVRYLVGASVHQSGNTPKVYETSGDRWSIMSFAFLLYRPLNRTIEIPLSLSASLRSLLIALELLPAGLATAPSTCSH